MNIWSNLALGNFTLVFHVFPTPLSKVNVVVVCHSEKMEDKDERKREQREREREKRERATSLRPQ